jgi:hypothetical protein
MCSLMLELSRAETSKSAISGTIEDIRALLRLVPSPFLLQM